MHVLVQENAGQMPLLKCRKYRGFMAALNNNFIVAEDRPDGKGMIVATMLGMKFLETRNL